MLIFYTLRDWNALRCLLSIHYGDRNDVVTAFLAVLKTMLVLVLYTITAWISKMLRVQWLQLLQATRVVGIPRRLCGSREKQLRVPADAADLQDPLPRDLLHASREPRVPGDQPYLRLLRRDQAALLGEALEDVPGRLRLHADLC